MKKFTRLILLAALILTGTAEIFGQSKIFYTRNTGMILSSDFNFSNFDTIASGLSSPDGSCVSLATGKLYWVEGGGKRHFRSINLDGTGLTIIDTFNTPGKQINPRGVTIDNTSGKLYILGGTGFATCNLDGSNMVASENNLIGGRQIAVNPELGKMYFTNQNALVYSANLDGSNRDTILRGGGSSTWGVRVDLLSNKLFFSDNRGIYRCDFDGSNRDTLIKLSGFLFVAFDIDPVNDRIVYCNSMTGRIYSRPISSATPLDSSNLNYNSIFDVSIGVGAYLQSKNINFENIGSTSFTARWTKGNGSSRLVFVKADTLGAPSPINGTTYTANSTFGLGTQIGTTGWFCVYNGADSVVTVNGLSSGTKYRVMVCEYSGVGATIAYNRTPAILNPRNVSTNIVISPTVNIVGSLNSFNACSGFVSTNQSFTVSGSSLTANITINAPGGFEVSTSSSSGFGSSLILSQSGGTVNSTTIFVRLAANATGTPSGNITASSAGATTQNVNVSGTVNSNPSITLGTINPVLISATSFGIPFTINGGSPNQYSITAGTPNSMSGFTAVSNATLGSSPISVVIPASAAGTYNFNLTFRNTNTTCASNSIPFALTVGNPAPSVSISGSFDPITACSGTASGAQQFKVGGTFLTGDVTVTAPTGFEVASTLTGTFGATINLSSVSGTIVDTPMYVRMSSAATGEPSGSITAASTGATTQSVNIAGAVLPIPAKPEISIKPANPICKGAQYLNFGSANAPAVGVSYQWSALNASVYAQGSTKQYALISFPTSGDVEVILRATENGCSAQTDLELTVANDEAHTATVRYFNSNFVCNANLVNQYQWGFDEKPSLKGNVIGGAINQNYFNESPDLITKSYWVISTAGSCYQKSYYNAPSSVATSIIENGSIQVYPNPFVNVVNISSSMDIRGAIVNVLDINGKQIHTQIAPSNTFSIYLQDQSAGVYFIQIQTADGGFLNSKVIKY